MRPTFFAIAVAIRPVFALSLMERGRGFLSSLAGKPLPDGRPLPTCRQADRGRTDPPGGMKESGIMQITLMVTEGPEKGRSFSFSGHDTFMVGRDRRAHFQLPANDRYASRFHFLVEVNPPHCLLMDLNARNKTYVNEKPITKIDLKHGDEIRAGHTRLRGGTLVATVT